MTDINDIWKKNRGKIPDDKLMAYMEGKLSAEEQREVEAWLTDEGMEADALEGLRSTNTTESKAIVNKLNLNLQKQLKRKPGRRKQLKDNYWAWVAILIVLILCIVAYLVLHISLKN